MPCAGTKVPRNALLFLCLNRATRTEVGKNPATQERNL
jgi:hypothetical protein